MYVISYNYGNNLGWENRFLQVDHNLVDTA